MTEFICLLQNIDIVFEQIIVLGGALWFVLAFTVGFHARGHNRSGFIWFFIILLTGIFGLAFYLLAITSADGEQQDGEASDSVDTFDTKLKENSFPILLGAGVGVGINLLWSLTLMLTTEYYLSPVDLILHPTVFLFAIIGAVVLPIISNIWQSVSSSHSAS